MTAAFRLCLLISVMLAGFGTTVAGKEQAELTVEETISYLNDNMVIHPGLGRDMTVEITGSCNYLKITYTDPEIDYWFSTWFGPDQISAIPQSEPMIVFDGRTEEAVLLMASAPNDSATIDSLPLWKKDTAACNGDTCSNMSFQGQLVLFVDTGKEDAPDSRIARAMSHLLTLCGPYIDPFAQQGN